MGTIDFKQLLGMAIKTYRNSLGISQEELAHRAGLHRTYLSDLERGTRNPSIESIEKLAGALQVSISRLFESVGNGDGSRKVVEILLVEDNPRDVDLTIRAFKKAGITNPLHVARDGQEALDFVFGAGAYAQRRGGRHPQLILLDLDLPKIAGLEVLRRLKQNKRTRNVPVIVLTVSNEDRDIILCRKLGAQDYIVKPVGFQNFSQVTPHLQLGWTLVREDRRRSRTEPAHR
jgi:CheY-like chemotaxis protein